MKKYLLLIATLMYFVPSYSQQFYRVRADISVKEKLPNGSYRLTVGKAYYDKVYQKLVYRLTFPDKETLVMQDTTMFQIDKNNKLKSTSRTMVVGEFTIFHLALTGKLANYGLAKQDNNLYKILKVEKQDNRIITTWTPKEESFKKYMGNIIMANIGKRLDGIVFYDEKGKIVSKQYFKNYVNVKGVEFPLEVTQINYRTDGKSAIQQTTYKNIVIDQNDEDEIYRYRVPITKSLLKK